MHNLESGVVQQQGGGRRVRYAVKLGAMTTNLSETANHGLTVCRDTDSHGMSRRAGASSVLTDDVTVISAAHGRERRAERGILKSELQAAVNAMKIGTSTIILEDKKVEGALDDVEDALKIINNGGKGKKKDPLELLTKASKDLSCDSGPGLEKAQQDLCDAVVDCIIAVANDMKLK